MKKPASKPNATKAVTKVSDSSLRRLVGYHMKRAFNVVQTDLTKTLKPFDLRMITYSALVTISENPGLRQSQLADAIDIERPNLVVIIDELERRDLIVRDRVPNDRRAYALKTTPLGDRLLSKAFKSVVAHEEELLASLSPEERTNLISALKLIENSQKKDTP